MLKIKLFLIVMILMTCLVGCQKVEPKTFTELGISITLDTSFTYHRLGINELHIISNQYVVTGNHEDKSELLYQEHVFVEVADYAWWKIEKMKLPITSLQKMEGTYHPLTYCIYDVIEGKYEYRHAIAFFDSESSYYVVDIYGLKRLVEKNNQLILNYLISVKGK